jgi:hypothetical protein
MVTVSTGGDGGVPGAAKAQSLRHKRAATKIADEQTERFIMVYLLKTFELRNSPKFAITEPRDCKSGTAVT